MIKMIVSDIDGTLVDYGKPMTERMKQTIRRAIEKGIIFVVASGRTYRHACEIPEKAGIDCCVVSANGGRADSGIHENVIYEDTFDDETSMKVYNVLIEAGCYMTAYVGTKIYYLSERNGFGSTCIRVSEAMVESENVIGNVPERMKNEGTKHPYKYEAYTDDPVLMDKLRKTFTDMGLSVSSAFPFNLEILPAGGGKGKAVRELKRIFGVKKEEIMAMGDGSNDLTMLMEAGLPVALENAVDELKAVAKVIAPSCKVDGGAWAIEKYALGENV